MASKKRAGGTLVLPSRPRRGLSLLRAPRRADPWRGFLLDSAAPLFCGDDAWREIAYLGANA
jgi:hypothetical protein